jgi:two-component system, cell cycle sensor histidine kinase and response regulator CckA
VVKCHAELLRDDLRADDPLQSNVHEIERAANRAAEVTQQLLAFSRKQLMQPRRVSLDAVVTEALPVLRQLAGTGVDIATSTDGSSPFVFADPTHLENVLITLVRNAREAMPRGGRVTLGTESRKVEAHDLALQSQHIPEGLYAVLTVTDTGAGMDGTVQRRLFEPFFTTKQVGAGSGLGLAGMFGIVRQSGGYVDVESAPNRGSTFSIYLPASNIPTEARPVPA